MKLLKMKKGIAALAAVAIVAIAAIGAYAYFTNTGEGTKTDAVEVLNPPDTLSWTVSFGTTAYAGESCPACTLAPTVVADPNAVVATVPFTITNDTEADEFLDTYTASIVPASLPSGCTAQDFSVGGALPGDDYTELGLGVTLQPNSDAGIAGTTSGNHFYDEVTIQMIEDDTIQDGCQGATPDLKITASS